MEGLPAIEIVRLDGQETFQAGSGQLPVTLRDFWAWSASDIVGNTMRGVLAEFIVATAIGKANGVRAEWDAYDLLSSEGIRIEVKSAAYIQSWEQRQHSAIQFGIQPTHGWNMEANERSGIKERQADVYVFCLLAHRDQATLDPLNMDQWEFYVLPTKTLNENLPEQKTISLARLLKLNPTKAEYANIATSIRQVTNQQ